MVVATDTVDVVTDTEDVAFNELKKLSLHTFVKRKQVASFNSLKTSCDGKSIVLRKLISLRMQQS